MLYRRRWMLARPPLDVPFSLNRHHSAAHGLIAWWPFIGSRGANILLDFSGHGRHGAFAGAGSPAWVTDGELGAALSLDGSSDYVNAYSVGLRDAFNGAQGTVIAWAKVYNSGVWTDGSDRYVFSFRADDNNYVRILKLAASNQLAFRYRAGGTLVAVSKTSVSDIAFMRLAITWSKAVDAVKAYYNGVQEGATQTGLGTWAGQLASTTTVIGAPNMTPTNVWHGYLGDVKVYNRALAPHEIWQDWDLATRWDLYRPLRAWRVGPRLLPPGFALGAPNFEKRLCEADCEMDVQRMDILRETRTAGGQLKRDVVASKRVFRFAYSWLPGGSAYTYDGGMGRDELWDLYTAGRELSLHLPLQAGYMEDVTVRFRAGSWRDTLLLRDSPWGFVYALNFELEEV